MIALLLMLSTPASAQQPPSAAVVQQDVLPALAARASRANARIRAAEAWFAGRSGFGDAWPAHASVDVLDGGFLRATHQRLASEARARAGERIAPLPEDATLARSLTRARTTALDSEDRFAQLEERLVAGLQAGLAKAPGLDGTVLRPVLADLDATIAGAGPDAATDANEAATAALADKTRIQTLRRAAIADFTVPGSAALRAELDLLDVVPPSAAHLALLAAVQPLVEGERAASIQTVLDGETARIAAEAEATRRAELDAARAVLDSPPPLMEEETLEVLQGAVSEARAAVEAAPAEARELLGLKLELAEKRLAIRAGEVAEDASAAQKRADEAREAAEQTRLAGQKEDKALSALRGRVLAAQHAVAEVYEQEAARREESKTRLDSTRARLDERIEAGANAMALSLIDANRQSSIDRAYLDLRSTVRSLYEELDTLKALEKEQKAEAPTRLALLDNWTAGRGSTELAKLDDTFQAASADLREALDNRDRTLKATRDEVYRLLDVARDNRRTLKNEASSAARAQARRDFFPELQREVSALPGQLAAGARGVVLALLGIPSFLGNVDALWALLLGSFELVVVVGLWGVGRRQMTLLAGRLLELAQERLGGALEGERERAVAQLASLGVALLDLLTALFVFSRLGEGMGVFGLVLLLWATRSALTAAPLVARCALASPEQMHPSLRLVTAPTENLAARSLWWIAAWAGLSKLGTYTMVALLDADRLRDVVGALSSLAFWGLLLGFVVAWGPVAVSTLARQTEHSALTAWAARATGTGWITRLFSAPRFVVALGIVATQLTVHVFGQLIEGRAGFGWLQSALARRQLKAEDTETVQRTPPPDVVLDTLREAANLGMPREPVDARLAASFDAWKTTRRRGLVSLTGDVGSGKAQMLHRLPAILQTEVVDLTVAHRIATVEGVVGFLAEGLGIEATDVDSLTEALARQEPRVIAVDRAHLLFLRCVRGYAPLQALITVMTATADRHFWILAVHEPAWDYLMGIAARLKLDAFRDHIRLEDAEGPTLATWLETKTREAGLEISYDQLATTGLLGGDEGLAERRARGAYWRLLSDAAGGIPAIAVELWTRSLSLGDDGKLDVRMFDAPSADDIQSVPDGMLFALKALVQHERLTSDELAKVLNQRPGAARSAAKHLVHTELAEYDAVDLTYSLPALWSPAVQRLLRQKHFLYAE